ncbi:6-phosphogluconolactonase [Costertonia aggregata]|uniref:6-phosphogluconolactonase n=1 Tax=Costertonia aggregata TaxID=343403 RepID=A0A7H9AKR7_9FLAO|nr:6-phosphogluconolactonase [Costertonia aggregata]QLG43924.1 6-phosphogluconolactonase [Costertonia aggregata]
MKIKVYKDKEQVADEFSKYLFDYASERDITHIALSGGSTPKIVFDKLASDYADKMDWQKIHFYWGDERCVPPTDNDSNYKMTAEHLLSKIDIPSENIHRIKGEKVPVYEADRYSAVLKENLPEINAIPQFDLVILGMGDDGHTASIFPHEIHLWDSQRLCEVATHPDSGQNRVSITGKLINNAKSVVFLVTGASKASKITEIIGRQKDFEKYPATLVRPTSGRLLWFLDDSAAKGIA